MASEDYLTKFKRIVPDYPKLKPELIVDRLTDVKVVSKVKKAGLSEGQVSQLVLYIRDHQPNARQLEAFIRNGLR